MYRALSHADPPLTLAERLDRLNDTLQSLAHRLKESIAEAVGSAVAGAVRDGVRHLLGGAAAPAHLDHRPYFEEPQAPGWHDSAVPMWADQDDVGLLRRPQLPGRPTRGRWLEALGVALQAGLCWLGHQPRRSPALTVVTVAVATGVAALLALA
jgi:hypothetical protein